MRTEQEMMDLILSTARDDGRIRAAYLNGSRTNIHAPKDPFQDYDLVYVVTQTAPFYEDPHWIDRFGPRLYLQQPDENDAIQGKPVHMEDNYGWLMQLADGNRIDLHVQSISYAQKAVLQDTLCWVLLDKDGILPPVPPSSDVDYWVRKPDQARFQCTCNEFWWCLNNVAKGLWRKELVYVQEQLNLYIRPMLLRQLSWLAGSATGFSFSPGKAGKYLPQVLPPALWQRYLDTFAGCDCAALWTAVETLCALFEETARQNAAELHLTYDAKEAQNSWAWLRFVRTVPTNATDLTVPTSLDLV